MSCARLNAHESVWVNDLICWVNHRSLPNDDKDSITAFRLLATRLRVRITAKLTGW
jgi:hypothetical protein